MSLKNNYQDFFLIEVLQYQSAGEGLTVNTTTQAKDLSSVYLVANGKNLVDCTYVQCFRGRSAIEL